MSKHEPQPIELIWVPLEGEPDTGEAGQVSLVKEPRAGDLCPKCREGRLDYNGLLNLACPKCGYAVGGCFT